MLEGKQSIISRSRREFIKGRVGKRNYHIASVLVQAWPEKLAAVESELTHLAGVESHGSNGTGKLIVTVETADDAGLVDTMRRIEMADGVIVASLVYHHMEETGDD